MLFKVLLVDDEPRAIEGLQFMIDWEGLGFQLCGSCENGAEALELVARLTPDLIITDIRMPIMDGLELIAEIMSNPVKPPKIIILSAYSEFEYAKRAMQYGIRHYILKPIISEDVSELLQEVYEELKTDSELYEMNDIIQHEEILTQVASMLYGDIPDISLEIKKLNERNSSWHFICVETEEGNHLRFRDSARRFVKNRSDAFMIDLGADVFGFVCGHNEGLAIKALADGLFQTLMDVSPTGFAMSVSMEASNLETINECYRTAIEAINYKFFQETPSVIYYSSPKVKAESFRFGEMKEARIIVEALEHLDITLLQTGFAALFGFCQTHRVNPEMVRMIAIHVVYKSLALIKEMEGIPAELLKKHGILGLENKNLSLVEIITMVKDYCEECIELLMKLQRDQSQGIIHEINLYIGEHFQEIITLKELAELFYIHPVYLGQLFMKKNRIGFNSYVHDLRIAEAVKLIRTTKLKAHQIAAQVGYSNYDKFLKQFEKRMQMKPNEFKKEI